MRLGSAEIPVHSFTLCFFNLNFKKLKNQGEGCVLGFKLEQDLLGFGFFF